MRFPEDIVWQVWSAAYVTTITDALHWRKDECGAWIKRTDYNNEKSEYGWVIDHIVPESQGGTDDIANLRPLQWENVARKKDGSLECPVTSTGAENTRQKPQ